MAFSPYIQLVGEPDPAVPRPPDHLIGDALAEWQRVAPGLYRAGLLLDLETAVLAAYCTAHAEWVIARRQSERGGPLRPRWMKMAREAKKAAVAFAAEYKFRPRFVAT